MIRKSMVHDDKKIIDNYILVRDNQGLTLNRVKLNPVCAFG